MRKILVFSYNVFLLIISTLFYGCNPSSENYNFQPKSYNDYYNALENTTIEMEIIINDKRAQCFYTNDSQYYVYTIKYQYSHEYGYIYDTKNNELYCIENQVVTGKKLNNEAEDSISRLYTTTNILFHLKYDYSQFEYISSVTVCNRECYKYRFVDEINGDDATFNIYIDKDTGFCLKGVCVTKDSTNIYFETKKFLCEPTINSYMKIINDYKKNTH